MYFWKTILLEHLFLCSAAPLQNYFSQFSFYTSVPCSYTIGTWHLISHRTCALRMATPLTHNGTARTHRQLYLTSWLRSFAHHWRCTIINGNINGRFAHVDNDFVSVKVSVVVSLASQYQFLLFWIQSNLPNIMDRCNYFSPTIIGLRRCRSMVDNTIKRSHLSGSHTWSTSFHCVRWCWHTSPLFSSPMRTRSRLLAGSASPLAMLFTFQSQFVNSHFILTIFFDSTSLYTFLYRSLIG